MIGYRFGRLVILDMVSDGRRGTHFLCRCDCGNEKVVSRNNLTTGNTTSCGCKIKERRTEDLDGRRFGRLVVVGFDHTGSYGESYWSCICDCGNSHIVSRRHLLNGHSTSCGCWNKESHTTHGMKHTSLYTIWVDMKQRCRNPKHVYYDRYGGNDIDICAEWEQFEGFRDWAFDSGYRPGLTIDRINNDLGYYPENCRWSDWYTQANNRRNNRHITYNGVTHTIAEWARILGVPDQLLRGRINRNDMQNFDEYFENLED